MVVEVINEMRYMFIYMYINDKYSANFIFLGEKKYVYIYLYHINIITSVSDVGCLRKAATFHYFVICLYFVSTVLFWS